MFINLVDNKFLDPQGFTPFGRVVSGMDVVGNKLFSGYGEHSDKQTQILTEGNIWLEKNFPHLSYIHSASIVPK